MISLVIQVNTEKFIKLVQSWMTPWTKNGLSDLFWLNKIHLTWWSRRDVFWPYIPKACLKFLKVIKICYRPPGIWHGFELLLTILVFVGVLVHRRHVKIKILRLSFTFKYDRNNRPRMSSTTRRAIVTVISVLPFSSVYHWLKRFSDI